MPKAIPQSVAVIRKPEIIPIREMQEKMRAKIYSKNPLNAIEKLEKDMKYLSDQLGACDTQMKKSHETRERRNIMFRRNVLRDQLQVTEKLIEHEFRKLKFILPELRSVELTDPHGNNPLTALSAAIQGILGHDPQPAQNGTT